MEKDTQQIILDTARKIFVRKGYAATKTQEIADEAGLNKALLHYYFRTKEQLFHEISRQIVSGIIPEFARAVDFDGGVWEKLDALVEKYITILLEYPDIPFFVMSEITQQRESFINEIKGNAIYFGSIKNFLLEFQQEIDKGNIRTTSIHHLFLSIIGMTVFPFIARPIFNTIFEVTDSQFRRMMEERKEFIMDFVQNSVRIKK